MRLTSGVGVGYDLIDNQTTTWRVGLDLALLWNRTTKPPSEADATRPKSNDFRTPVALSIDF